MGEDDQTDTDRGRWRVWDYLRAAFALTLVVWMFAAPGAWHIGVRYFGIEQPWWGKGWVMMRGTGRDMCKIEVFEVDADGNETPVDRLERLGYDDPDEAPRSVKRVFRKGLTGHVKRVCSMTPADRDLRVRAHCAGYEGWDEVFKGKKNICSAKNMRQGNRVRSKDRGGRSP